MRTKKESEIVEILQSIDYFEVQLLKILKASETLEENKSLIVKKITEINPNETKEYWEGRIELACKSCKKTKSALEEIKKIRSNVNDNLFVEESSLQYIELIRRGISNEQEILRLASKLDASIPQKDSSNYKGGILRNSLAITNLVEFIFQIEEAIRLHHQRLYHINILKKIDKSSQGGQTFIIIGANGSGKSSFSRSSRELLGENITIISAQKIFVYQPIESIPISQTPLENIHRHHMQDKMGKDFRENNQYLTDLHNLISMLIADHNNKANTFYNESKDNKESANRASSLLEQTIEIWNKVLIHRKMISPIPSLRILTNEGEGDSYDFTFLSDGEKASFYYIGHILAAKENSFIIVDEPENHLNPNICRRLWDLLEKSRSDCKFIYLTHNLDFASSRINAKKLWCKKFTPPAQWEIEELPTDGDLPEALLMELLGSRRKILFCEGSSSSLDYKLYTILFPEYTIKPVGGHLDVISFTRAFNRNKETFNNSAIGIIDGDYHAEEEKNAWKKDSIYCLEVQEVENLICDDLLLQSGKERFLSGDSAVDDVKKEILKKVAENIDQQAVDYATQVINNTLKSNLLDGCTTQEEIKNKLQERIGSINVEELVQKRKQLLEDITAKKDYERAIKYSNNKGLLGEAKRIVPGYRDRIFKLLENEPTLVAALRKKHFSHIPSPVAETLTPSS